MSLYAAHLQTLKHRFQLACEQFNLDAIVLHSGNLTYYAYDDISHVFHPDKMAQQWLPYDVAPDTWVIISANGELSLKWPAKQDFWHVSPSATTGDWTNHWALEGYIDLEWLNKLNGNIAILSSTFHAKNSDQSCSLNPTDLIHWLNFDRAVKTDWEIEQISLANKRAASGHKAAAEAFLSGASELEIHFAYLAATQQQQAEEPYSAIVGINENAATLHYERKSNVRPRKMNTLLIDAGCNQNGFASDITRTTTTDRSEFKALLSAIDTYQQSLNALCRAGTLFSDIHQQALFHTAKTLNELGICNLSVEEQINKCIPHVFFPHGIGHLLGLQVHDVGGHQQDRKGTIKKPDQNAPFLRLNRVLEPGYVLTIEPGIYFIPMLLDKMQAETPNHGCNFELIEKLKPFGGVRIEDNIIVTNGDPINATRNAFDQCE